MPASAGSSGAVRDYMRSGTQEAGMDPAEVARLVLAAIIAGRSPEFGLAKSWKLEGE